MILVNFQPVAPPPKLCGERENSKTVFGERRAGLTIRMVAGGCMISCQHLESDIIVIASRPQCSSELVLVVKVMLNHEGTVDTS